MKQRKGVGEPHVAAATEEGSEAEKPAAAGKPLLRPTGVPRQLLNSLPYGIGAGLVVSAAWLMAALFMRQWNQVSAFTLGITVPWALYKGTTMKKQMGIPVWRRAPSPGYVSLVSGPLTVAMIALMEYAAFRILYRSSTLTTSRPSDFAARWLGPTGWVLIGCGIALAFLVPFLLSAGESLTAPSRRGKQEGGGAEGGGKEPGTNGG